MSTITFQAEISEADFPIFEVLFSKFKIKPLILEKKEDDTLIAKEDFFKMIDEARASKKTKASKQELINMLYK